MKSAVLQVALVLTAGLSPLRPQVQPASSGSKVVDSPSPLSEVAMLLKQRYRKVVTYEEPILVWRGDLVEGKDPEGPFGLWPKDRHFAMPSELDPQRTPELDLEVLRAVVEAYNNQNYDGPLYQATESQFGLHILPLQMHAANGELVKATSLLDTRVNLPPVLRMPSEHFQALCDAVTASEGAALRLFFTGILLDRAFAPNGLQPPKGAAQLLSAKEKEPFSIVWGASGVTARQALVNLIRLSATKLTWFLLCQPSAKPENRFCVLNLDAL